MGAQLTVGESSTQGDMLQAARRTARVMVIEARLYEAGEATLRQQVYVLPTTLVIADRPRCAVRKKDVAMPVVAVAAFKGPGTTAGERSYDLELECEAGVGQVKYQVEPTTTVVDMIHGVAEATGGVAGVGYQFLDDAGSPLQFRKDYDFGRGSATATTLKKAFLARYRQIGPSITPGQANAGLTFTLSYP